MKPQDILFIAVLVVLLIFRRPRWLVIAGLISLAASIPLFTFWIFFTAERFVYYAWAFFTVASIMLLLKNKR